LSSRPEQCASIAQWRDLPQTPSFKEISPLRPAAPDSGRDDKQWFELKGSEMPPEVDVLGIGNAIVDVLAPVEEAFLKRYNLHKGAMTLVAEDEAEAIYAAMPPATEMSGGSVANSMAGFASLGGKGAYIGKVKKDTLGNIFAHDLKSLGLKYGTGMAEDGPSTARCVILITPDGQRTMNTYLGAAVTIQESDIDAHLVANAAVTYIEGYLFDTAAIRPALKLAAELAHKSKRKIAFTLSDAWLVDRHRDDMRKFVHDHVDILFANEMELLSFYQTADLDQAFEKAHQDCELVAVTRSGEGSMIYDRKQKYSVSAHPVAKVVDTTGAGDLYAAGFLFGLTRQMPLDICGKLGSLCAAEVISHLGPRPQVNLKEFAGKHVKIA
jgi:sugar/nucleoside kinase (ribokinase family)